MSDSAVPSESKLGSADVAPTSLMTELSPERVGLVWEIMLTLLVALDGPGLIQTGLLVLIATPVARVAFSAFAFAAQGDRAYVVITLVVLAVLGFSLLGTGP